MQGRRDDPLQDAGDEQPDDDDDRRGEQARDGGEKHVSIAWMGRGCLSGPAHPGSRAGTAARRSSRPPRRWLQKSVRRLHSRRVADLFVDSGPREQHGSR